MKLPLTIVAPFLTSLSAVKPIRRIKMSHGEVLHEAFLVGRTYVVQEGCARLFYIETDGRRNFRHLIGTGGMFGDLPFAFSSLKRTEYAVMSGPTHLAEFSRVALEKESMCNHEFNQTLVRAYGACVSFHERRLQWQLTNPVLRRAALALTDLLCFGAGPCPNGRGYLVQIRMTQEEFAELLGVACQTLNAVMKEWKQQGLVSYTRSRFCICNLEALQKIVS